MMDTILTAAQAKDIADKVYTMEDLEICSYAAICDLIKKKAENGYKKLVLSDYCILTSVIEKLRADGFKIQRFTISNIEYAIIEWAEVEVPGGEDVDEDEPVEDPAEKEYDEDEV